MPLPNLPITPPNSSGSSSRTLSTASDSSTTSLGPPMTQEDVKVIFGNISEIAVFSDLFCQALEEALGDLLEGGKGDDHVGALFLSIVCLSLWASNPSYSFHMEILLRSLNSNDPTNNTSPGIQPPSHISNNFPRHLQFKTTSHKHRPSPRLYHMRGTFPLSSSNPSSDFSNTPSSSPPSLMKRPTAIQTNRTYAMLGSRWKKSRGT